MYSGGNIFWRKRIAGKRFLRSEGSVRIYFLCVSIMHQLRIVCLLFVLYSPLADRFFVGLCPVKSVCLEYILKFTVNMQLYTQPSIKFRFIL